MFDLLVGAQYPAGPPRCLISTTGGGKVRFNPNLYAEGKVCLSLLGTFSGPGWEPGRSTILQLLLSIQALVFNSWPYENEPCVGAACPSALPHNDTP